MSHPPAPPTPRGTQLLKLLTCGSVDDGKSTLIGRLLYDCRAVFADQIAAIEKASKRRGDEKIDLSLFTDGLRWEREQGITIDVAYRYFSTATRRYILIDCPGHAQYTRNMVTGASHADLALILVDVRHGVQEQTRRHAYLAAMLGIRQLIVCVNKMDLVNWDKAAFDAVVAGIDAVRAELGAEGNGSANITFVPVSALNGDNIAHRSAHTPWYTGQTILEHLESADTHAKDGQGPARFPVQYVIRPRERAMKTGEHDFRGFAGQVASGTFKVGDRVHAMSSGRDSTIESIRLLDERLPECRPPQSVVITLTDDIDISRGDLLVKSTEHTRSTRELVATCVWMGPNPLKVGRRYLMRHTTHFVPAIVTAIESKLDIHTLKNAPSETGAELKPNDIATIRVKTADPIFADTYTSCRSSGSFVLIDESTFDTSGAGLIREIM